MTDREKKIREKLPEWRDDLAHTHVGQMVLDELEQILAIPEKAAQCEPFAHAYRYADGIRLGTDGRTINGCAPIEVIPLYRAQQTVSEEQVREGLRYVELGEGYALQLATKLNKLLAKPAQEEK